MSLDEYASISTERLLDKFADAAKRTGLVREALNAVDSMKASIALEDTPASERTRAVDEVRAIGEALWARGPIEQAKTLLEDADPAVRVCAAIFFSDLDPEMADAAMSGAYARIPTREMLALKRRALEPPPLRPTLQEMSDDALVARFEDAATREYATRFLDSVIESQDMTDRNRILEELWDLMRELKKREALDLLLPLLANANVTVRREAATACLRVSEQASIAALEEIVANSGYDDSVPAQDTLEVWRERGLAVYGV